MSDLHERVAAALGWTVREAQGFSFQSLREMLRRDHPELASELTAAIRSGSYIAQPAPRRRARLPR